MLDFLKNYLGGQAGSDTSGLRQSVLNNFYNSNLANNVDNPMQPFPQPFAAQYGQTGQLGAGLRNALFLSHLQKGQQQQSMFEQQRQQAAQTPVRLDPGAQPAQAAPAQQAFAPKWVPINQFNNQGLRETKYYPVNNADIYSKYQRSFYDNGTANVNNEGSGLSGDEYRALLGYSYA